MALDFISKQGIIIGAVSLLACLAALVEELPRINYMFTNYSPKYALFTIGIVTVTLLAAIFSILLIVGIVKRRHILLAPWLVVGILSSVVASCIGLYDTMSKSRFYWSDLFFLFVFIGLQVVILHPIYNLYLEIQQERNTHEHKEIETNYTCNIQNTCEEGS